MALSLDDRLLGEKVHNYCSSSSDEADSDDDYEDAQAEIDPSEPQLKSASAASAAQQQQQPPPTEWRGVSSNTGPKGVVQDWQRYKQLQREQQESQEAELRALSKKLALTCRSAAEDAQEAELDAEFAEALAELEEDEQFLKRYRQKRLDEMRLSLLQLKLFGSVIELTRETFISEVDKEPSQVKVLLHIYEQRELACRSVNAGFNKLAVRYPTVKFCRILATQAAMSRRFLDRGLPAIVVYKAGEVTNCFVNLRRDLGNEFEWHDLESYLTEYGILCEDLVSEGQAAQVGRSGVRSEANAQSDSDSD